ncbi:MAG: hypothetical protein AAF639_11150 [Chloroflexota bacterium]
MIAKEAMNLSPVAETPQYADQTAVSTSDLDVLLIFKDEMSEVETDVVWDLSDSASLLTPMFLDLEGMSESTVLQGDTRLKLASHFLYGEDIRAQIPLPPIDAYVREWMHNHAIHFMMRVARGQQDIQIPATYPDPADEFFGYAKNPIEQKEDTKLLVAIVGQIATALVALKTQSYIATKRESVRQYQAHINDEWTGLVTGIYEVCRNQWAYQIPSEPVQRSQLRAFCEQTLAFENHFLAIYRDYL